MRGHRHPLGLRLGYARAQPSNDLEIARKWVSAKTLLHL